jgi:hypothetical protein
LCFFSHFVDFWLEFPLSTRFASSVIGSLPFAFPFCRDCVSPAQDRSFSRICHGWSAFDCAIRNLLSKPNSFYFRVVLLRFAFRSLCLL